MSRFHVLRSSVAEIALVLFVTCCVLGTTYVYMLWLRRQVVSSTILKVTYNGPEGFGKASNEGSGVEADDIADININHHLHDHGPQQELSAQSPSNFRLEAIARRLKPSEYTIGWICAIPPEYVAAQAVLEEQHARPEQGAIHDDNDYTLGAIKKHNITIACLPHGEYGISTATSVGNNMLRTYTNIKILLMVGIGGGAPTTTRDIRLGDVVVSSPRDGAGGVLQLDYGKIVQGQDFLRTGSLNSPPQSIRSVVSGLATEHVLKGHQIVKTINEVLRRMPRLQKEFGPREANSDRLYKSDVLHNDSLGPDGSCEISCGTNSASLTSRRGRSENEDNPAIHYGLIASSNSLMKDATLRDRLAAELNILCFEMEAAGLMNLFPCLIVRGICDYADTHKNKAWQGYAAMTAAAYTKELLSRLSPSKVEDEPKIVDLLSGLSKTAEGHRDIAKQQLFSYHQQIQHQLTKEEEHVHQLFRLADEKSNATYEWYKNRIEDRVEGTCLWFLQQEKFKSWLLQSSSGPLFVSADPGCGKSVLARYLIDDYLPSHLPQPSTTICYFFFKDQDQSTLRQALCAIVHQLLSHRPSLIKHAMKSYRKDGDQLINSPQSLWEVYHSSMNDPEAGSTVIVLDALDECDEPDFRSLMRNIEDQFDSGSSGYGQVRYLFTGRPYSQIIEEFRGLLQKFPNVHIPGEQESGLISQEIDHVISSRFIKLSQRKKLPTNVQTYLNERLRETPHRTYLWVYLVFSYLENIDFKKTVPAVKKLISSLPGNVYAAYERILSRANQYRAEVHDILVILLAAGNPLTIQEMNIAVNINSSAEAMEHIDVEADDDFKSRLSSSCGLFVTIHHDKVYFLHQTARDFLLKASERKDETISSTSWAGSIDIQQAHAKLAEICVHYLNLLTLDTMDASREEGPNQNTEQASTKYRDQRPGWTGKHVFFQYAARWWSYHFQEANILTDDAVVRTALRLCDSDIITPVSLRSLSHFDKQTWHLRGILASSYLGVTALVEQHISDHAEVDQTDSIHGRTPLSFAAEEGHSSVVSLLLIHEASIDVRDVDGKTPLHWAAYMGRNAIVELLLSKEPNVDTRDNNGETPLHKAASGGNETMVRLLLHKGASVDIENNNGQTPLHQAISKGNETMLVLQSTPGSRKQIVELLLSKGVDPDIKDANGVTLLHWAALRGHMAIVKLLLGKGATVDTKSNDGRTPLHWAVYMGSAAIVELLLSKGASVDARANDGRTPLHWAACMGSQTAVELLLHKEADIEAKADDGRTPLHWAAYTGIKEIVQLLLSQGADHTVKSNDGRTPLGWAAYMGNKATVELLVSKGGDTDISYEYRQPDTSKWLSIVRQYRELEVGAKTQKE